MNDFYTRVFEVVARIPSGKVCTYGAIAAYLGAAKGARMVGYAMNLAHQLPQAIPAHRVVNRKGLLTGKHHFASPDLMQILLENEGITIIDDQIQDFDQKIWLPS